MVTSISNAISSCKAPVINLPKWTELNHPHLRIFELWVLIFSNLDVKDLCRCEQVCREWKIVADDEGLWKQIVRSQVLGEKVWEEAEVGDVGGEPAYRMVPFNGMAGVEIPWKEVCKMHKNPSSYLDRVNKRMIKMPEFDFLVPATIKGRPTTIRHVIEVFKNARLPIGCSHIDPNIEATYGDIPIEKSYFARHTWTVANDTREKDPGVQVAQIHEKGQRLYRLHKIIEKMIFQFLCYQAGIKSGYGIDTWSQCLETLTVNGVEYPAYAGAFKPPAPGAPGGLRVGYSGGVNETLGAGGLREL